MAARELPSYMEKYGQRGFIAIQLLGENHRHNPPMVVDLQAWADTFDIATPVLADPEWLYADWLWRDGPAPFRVDQYALLGRGAVLLSKDKPTDEMIELALAPW